MIDAQKVNNAVEALKDEFPDLAITLVISNAVGQFSCSANIHPKQVVLVLAEVVKHFEDQIRGLQIHS